METGEDEGCDGWLPTLDTSLKVDERNLIQYKYYEKPTSSRECLHANSAMNMNSKMQILSNDMVRRLFNTSEGLGSKVVGEIVDNYAEKMMRSGYSREQTKKILLNGIKNFESKKKS